MQEFLVWEPRYKVGITMIDEQHKELVYFTNRLYMECISTDERADAAFKKVIKDAVAYVKVHFTMEEGLMSEYSYPLIVAHKKEHAKFIMKIIEEAVVYEKHGRSAALSFIRFLKDWLLGHIAFSDKELGIYLNSRGVL